MATATLKQIDDETLTALRSIEWDGNAATLTCGQLDRKTYEKTNKVLESLGGKWSRKAKAHLFDGEAQDDLEAVIENGGYVDHKQALGFFETPDELADEVVTLAELHKNHRILEPSAGSGQLVRAVTRRLSGNGTFPVFAVDIDDRHEQALFEAGAEIRIADFLSTDAELEANERERPPFVDFDRVIMNPPFARQQDIDHVRHAWTFLAPGGRLVSIMSPGWTFRTNRKSTEFKAFVEEFGSWREVEAGAFKESGTSVRTCIVVLDKRDDA